MAQSIVELSPSNKHDKLVRSYGVVISSVIKDYSYQINTTQADVELFRHNAISLIHDLETVLETAKGLSDKNRKRIHDLIMLLITFDKSLVITKRGINGVSHTNGYSSASQYAVA